MNVILQPCHVSATFEFKNPEVLEEDLAYLAKFISKTKIPEQDKRVLFIAMLASARNRFDGDIQTELHKNIALAVRTHGMGQTLQEERGVDLQDDNSACLDDIWSIYNSLEVEII